MLGLRTFPLAGALFFTLVSCSGNEEEYTEPVAEAGESQLLDLGQTVTLDGAASEVCCEKTLAYQWYFKQVPLESAVDDAVLGTSNGSPDAQTLQWVPDVPGSYVIGLIVSDDIIASAEDITVIEISKNNDLPMADAGLDQTGFVGEMITFDGSNSTDEKGVELEYEWILASTPTGSALTTADLYDADQTNASLVPDVSGSFVLGLRVNDKTDWSAPDYVTGRIASDNAAPVANAGDSRAIPPCESGAFELDGLGSYDPEGQTLDYEWSIKSLPDGSTATADNFDDASAARPHFSPDIFPGEYAFRLQVSDGESWSAYDEVVFQVSDAEANTAPVSDIDADVSVTMETDCPLVSGKRECRPCVPRLDVDGSKSYDPDGHDLIYTWSSDAGEFNHFDRSSTQFIGDGFNTTHNKSTGQTYSVSLNVSDCEDSNTETLIINVTCKGVTP